MAKKSTVNHQKRNIFTVNRQMSGPKLAVKFLFKSFFTQSLIIGLISVFKFEQNDIVLLKLTAKFVL